MKILLTGEPHSGKSTLLAKIVDRVSHKQGFVTSEILQSDQRMGFELVSSLGTKVKFADIRSDSPIRVSRYGLDVSNFDKFLANLPAIQPKALLYIDEIGQMQLYSKKFQELVNDYIAADNDFIGTISQVYQHSLIKKLKEDSQTTVINVNSENRNKLEDAIISRYLH